MRKVFVFWGIILLTLISGAVAIIYGKQLLEEELVRADKIKEELTLPKVPETPKLPPRLPEAKIEEVPESETPSPQLPPKETEIPTLSELPKHIDVESPETQEAPVIPETPEVPEATSPQTPSQPAGQ
jgi:hypothetical protein